MVGRSWRPGDLPDRTRRLGLTSRSVAPADIPLSGYERALRSGREPVSVQGRNVALRQRSQMRPDVFGQLVPLVPVVVPLGQQGHQTSAAAGLPEIRDVVKNLKDPLGGRIRRERRVHLLDAPPDLLPVT